MSVRHTGYIPTPPEQLAIVEDLLGNIQGSPEFGDVFTAKGSGEGKLSIPFKSVVHFFPKAFADEPQVGPDCTSHGTRNAADISRAAEIDIRGEPEAWVARGATEGIYGYRGSRGGGMNPGRATEWCVKNGLLLRQNYNFADLSRYNFSVGDSWGGYGPPNEVIQEAKKHPCVYFARIRSVEEARDALASGYGIHCGSNYGNDGRRDSKGRSRWNDSWNHDMCWGGCDDLTLDDMYFLVLNSWGVWNSGGQPDWGPIPGGSFLIPSSDAQRMIDQGECWAIGEVEGWPAKDLPDYGTGSYL